MSNVEAVVIALVIVINVVVNIAMHLRIEHLESEIKRLSRTS